MDFQFLWTLTSVTRFGEISSPLWQKIKSLWLLLEVLVCFWQIFEPTFAKKYLFTIEDRTKILEADAIKKF